MLRAETGRRYIVYPSWAEGQLPCSWRDLPAVLADPERSGFLDANDRVFLEGSRHLYPEAIQPARCLDGPWGGGIVAVEANPHPERWLPDLALSRIAGRRYPAMMLHPPDYKLPVGYLEPISDRARGYVLLGKAPRLYPTIITVEHAEAAGSGVYLAVVFKSAPKPAAGLDRLAEGFAAFGLTLSPPVGVSADLDADADSWFDDRPGLTRAWFEMGGPADGIGYLFAVTLYNALELRRAAGSRLFSVHLVADIEGRPNSMRDGRGG